MEVLPTLFAKVFVRRAFLGHDADARAMLPDFADVALDVESRNIVRYIEAREYDGVMGVFRLLRLVVQRGRTRVVVVAADAADSLVILLDVVAAVGHV